MSDQKVETILAYHMATKHHFHRYAPGPGWMDWATQPDPFRRYQGAPLIPLEILAPQNELPPNCSPAPLDFRGLSQLFFDSLALSAWKQAGGSRWALRVNPSSGNLHPTEGYLVCDAVPGLCAQPSIFHYAPKEHGLELRTTLNDTLWRSLSQGWPEPVCFVGLASVPWREAWKYGERAFRYCHHDAGHALATVRLAAQGLGWQARLLDELASETLGALLGLHQHQEVEPEHPDCLLAVTPQGSLTHTLDVGVTKVQALRSLDWLGRPNRLSASVIDWPLIAQATEATRKPPTTLSRAFPKVQTKPGPATHRFTGYSRSLIHQRRSAVAMDGQTYTSRLTCLEILRATMPDHPPFDVWPWPSRVHLALFVHRVEGWPPGLYFLVRNPIALDSLRTAMDPRFEWKQPADCPADLPLYLLQEAEARDAAREVSCHQDIAAEGCFSLGMIAEFENPIRAQGAWFYPRLFWECGLIGQVLYLEAERAGLRGTGIGCFFDDAMHQLLGLKSMHFQSLYHFTVGGPIEDERITALPAYSR